MRTENGHVVSRDYARLWELGASGKRVVCFVNYPGGNGTSRDVASTLKVGGGGVVEVSARGISYVWAETVEDFVVQCYEREVAFLDPEAGTVALAEHLLTEFVTPIAEGHAIYPHSLRKGGDGERWFEHAEGILTGIDHGAYEGLGPHGGGSVGERVFAWLRREFGQHSEDVADLYVHEGNLVFGCPVTSRDDLVIGLDELDADTEPPTRENPGGGS